MKGCAAMFDFIAEFIGTFVFLSVVLATGQAIPIAATLLSVIYFSSHISGGHINPAISTIMFVKGALPSDKYIGYVFAQILGGLLALYFYNMTSKGGVSKNQ